MSSKSFVIFCFALASLFSSTWGKSMQSSPSLDFPISETNAVLDCGGLITDPSKQIIYKVFDQVADNERCIWMIAPANATSFRVRLSSDFQWQDQFLNIAQLNHRAHNLTNIAQLNSNWTTVTANVLIVTFHSPVNANSRGFILEYEVASNTSALSMYSTNSFIQDDTFVMRHPDNRETYSNGELSTFVFPVQDNVFVQGASRLLIYKELGLEGCTDFVEVFSFNATTNRFVLRALLCGSGNGVPRSELFNSDDILLVVFHTDGSVVDNGFHLASAVANCSV